MNKFSKLSVSDSFNAVQGPLSPAAINLKQVVVQAGLIIVGVTVFALISHYSTKSLLGKIAAQRDEILTQILKDRQPDGNAANPDSPKTAPVNEV